MALTSKPPSENELAEVSYVCSQPSCHPTELQSLFHSSPVRGVSWSEVATVLKRKSHRGLDLNFSLNTEVNIWKGWKENGGKK